MIKLWLGCSAQTGLISVNPLYKAKKNVFKVCLVGTLNLCLRVPEKMQKTRDESDPSRLRKLPKTAPKLQNLNLADFLQFLDVFSVGDDQINF